MENFNSNSDYDLDPSGQGYYDGGYYGGPGGGTQEQQGFYGEAGGGAGVYPPSYGMETMDPSANYYPQNQYDYSQGTWDQTHSSSEWDPQMPAEKTQAGSYYFHSEFAPQIFGYPVNALAHETSYEAMYVASTTQSMSSSRWRSQRSSMLVTHSTLDGMLYSSVAGHPEASSSTLQAVYNCMFGIPKTLPMVTRQIIPPHAYRAPYGIEVDPSMSIMGGQIGITTILPLGGYAATISPSAVRIHAHGGLQLHDHDIEGMLCGTIHPHSDQGAVTHISVGGIPCGSMNREPEIHCMDLWQGLRTVSSRAFNDTYGKKIGVTTMATSHDKGSIVAGCSDGNLRVLDGSLRELATIKSHSGGVSSMAISTDGMLVATTGYSSRATKKESSVLYAFPDPSVCIYDLRYLGRGGMPHPFAGVKSAPHHVAFMPDVSGLPKNRLLIGSGRAGGGFQILVPFETSSASRTSFFLPPLEQQEFVTAICNRDDDLALGTSAGRVLRYRLAGYQPTKTSSLSSKANIHTPNLGKSPSIGYSATSHQAEQEKQPLEMPSFVPPIPGASLDPNLLVTGNDPGMRNGGDEKIKSLFGTYVLQAEPRLTSIGNTVEDALTTFGSLASTPLIPNRRRTVAPSLVKEAAPDQGDFLLTIPTSKLDLDVLANHNVVSKRYKGKTKDPKLNPNKFLYCGKLSSVCYKHGLNGRRKLKGHKNNGLSGDLNLEVPTRYRLKLRPNFKSAGRFDPSDYNDTGLFPGWDYAPTMPNAFASPVLLLLYFQSEIRASVLSAQCNEKLFSTKGYERALSPELGFVFHQIESLASFGLLHPIRSNSDPLRPRIGAFFPSNFLTALGTMPEAEQLQILDGSPAAVDPPRRPEAFYRFLAYQLDKELSKNSGTKLMDSLHGLDFMSINQFIAGSSPPTQSSTRALTVDLSYDLFARGSERDAVRFGEVLQHSLCRETRLRAWNQKSKSYETIVQRKIATSLPQILTLSCACAGRKEEDGLWVWRTDNNGNPWLPEIVDIELGQDGKVIVREMGSEANGQDKWTTFKGKSSLPSAVSKLVSEASSGQKHRYRLEAVLSFINDEAEGTGDDEHPGHHALHARVSQQDKRRVLKRQQEAAKKKALDEVDPSKLVLSADVSPETFGKRSEHAGKQLAAVDDSESEWILYNGFVTSKTIVEDARAFHVPFKEPCLVIFRSIDHEKKGRVDDVEKKCNRSLACIPAQVMGARSLSAGANKSKRNSNALENFEPGMLVAFDAEFVCVQEEEATLSETGSKITLRETRYAVGRISVIDCRTRAVILDDHVLPRERVVDYLTRFSGIVAEDLDPAKTPHNLISTRSAYLKLRYLMEQGCIFVGHGLKQDFATVNLVVPPHQILDTVEIFHQPGMRYISLRFLTNFVLGRDMQQDIHDSIEDASAAFELYEKALEWKRLGIFGKKLQEIYTHGQKTDWKLGIEEAS